MSDKTCICLFSTLYLPSMGGVQIYTASVARALKTMDVRVIIVTCATHGKHGLQTENGIEIVRLPCRNLLGGRYPVPISNEEARRLWQWLGSQTINHFVVNTRFYPLSIKALEFAENKGIVPLLIEHGSAHLTMGNAIIDKGVESVEHTMTRKCLQHPARYYAVSLKASAWLKHFGIESCGELPNSIDADSYARSASKRYFRDELGVDQNALFVSFIGRLVPEKGVRILADASQLLKERNIVIALGGDGPLLKELTERQGGALRVLGRLERADVAALLTQSDVMCLPSRSEGFATALLEAAACGTPSLVTDVGGTDELIPDERFGTILDGMDPRSVAQALIELDDNRDRLRSQSAKVAERVRNEYSWEKTARKMLDACAQAVRSS